MKNHIQMATQVILEIFVLVPIVICWIFIAIFIFKPNAFSMLTLLGAVKPVLGVGVAVTLILVGLRLAIWPGPATWPKRIVVGEQGAAIK